MNQTRVILVRHAETTWSLTGRHTGRTDLPLTPAGAQKAKLARAELAPETFLRVFVSPLRRAMQTCKLAGLADRAELRPELREWDYGDYEGISTADIHQIAPAWSLWDEGAPNGETPAQVGRRVDTIIEELRSVDGAAAVFSHGHLSRVLAARWIGLPVAAGRSFLLGTGSISVLGVDRGTAVIERWNDDGYLRRAAR